MSCTHDTRDYEAAWAAVAIGVRNGRLTPEEQAEPPIACDCCGNRYHFSHFCCIEDGYWCLDCCERRPHYWE